MLDSELFFLDTNVLIYYYQKESNNKKLKTENLINKCWNRKIRLAVSNQILTEFSSIATKKLKLSNEETETIIKDIIMFTNFVKFNYTNKTLLSAFEITKKFNKHFLDSLIIATMLENNIHQIYTENTNDFEIEGIKAINPFG